MSTVTTAIESSTFIRISFAAPHDNSNSILEYEILIKQKNGVYSELTAECDGSIALIRTQQYCDVSMATLRLAPYSLVFNDVVVAKAAARNLIGWSAYSVPNLVGGLIKTPPIKMTTPLRNSATSESQIVLTWAALTNDNTGGDIIDSYHLQWDSGIGGTSSWTNLKG